jgi:diguanylate cyclase (GGDEF)-like protein
MPQPTPRHVDALKRRRAGRFGVRIAAAGLTLLAGFGTGATVAAASDHVAMVGDLADQAIALVGRERDLVHLADPAESGGEALASARRDLGDVDREGTRVLAQFDRLGVELTSAIRSALGPLPVGGGNDGDLHAPPDIVYDAAIHDLSRIGSTPGALLPESTGNGNGGSLGLLLVAAGALLALGVAAFSNAVSRSDGQELQAMAWSDGLTGVANRRRLDRDLTEHAGNAAALAGTTSVIMVDLDHFKQVNDVHGHRVGDEVLVQIGALLTRLVRRGDVVYRYGGEEFCVLLPNATTDEARRVADRIVTTVRTVKLPDGAAVTVSVGIAEGTPDGVADTLAIADRAMFAAKSAGRNRVETGVALIGV